MLRLILAVSVFYYVFSVFVGINFIIFVVSRLFFPYFLYRLTASVPYHIR